MRTIRHTSYVHQRRRRARLLAIGGFGVLTATLFIALNPSMLIPAYIAMLVGFITFNIGMQQIGKWGRNPRNDQLVDRALDKLSDRYVVVHYADIGGNRLEHLLVYPGGLIVLTAKEIDGDVSVSGNKWKRRQAGLRRLFAFSGPQLGQPGVETDVGISRVEAFLEEAQLELDVDGVITFLHPGVDLQVEDPEYPVLHGDELSHFLQELEPDESFGKIERDRLLSLLSSGADEVPATQTSQRRRPTRRVAAAKPEPEKIS